MNELSKTASLSYLSSESNALQVRKPLSNEFIACPTWHTGYQCCAIVCNHLVTMTT